MNAAPHPTPAAPELLEPARALPCEEGMDDQGEYATAMGREALEGGLWLPLEVPTKADAVQTLQRLRFLRRELAHFEAQAAFNRRHYSETEAACWDALAADARASIAEAAGSAA